MRLETQGPVHVYPNRGAFVISLSAGEVREIYEMRLVLEGDIIERAVPSMTADDWRRTDAAPTCVEGNSSSVARCTSRRAAVAGRDDRAT